MSFDLTNVPATFCNLINDLLYNFLDNFVVVYLNYIVIYNKEIRYHVIHLSKVLNRLRDHELFVKKEKYEFAKSEIMFLGHLFGEG
jgi:hypothetical protein